LLSRLWGDRDEVDLLETLDLTPPEHPDLSKERERERESGDENA
jgi:hypothetical protein